MTNSHRDIGDGNYHQLASAITKSEKIETPMISLHDKKNEFDHPGKWGADYRRKEETKIY